MKRLLLVCFIGLSTFYATAQDEKWSVEANYPFVLHSNLQNDLNGVLDLGIKYRFANLGPVILGVGFNAAYLKNNDNSSFQSQGENIVSYDYKAKQFLLQPKIFAELPIPGLPAFRPQVGIGYTVTVWDLDYQTEGEPSIKNSNTDGGLNLNVGLSYDISKCLFLQIQYDYLNVELTSESEINGQSTSRDFNEKTGFLKAGVGLRF